jgi:hypothetical protein
MLRVDDENSFWYIGVLDFGKKPFHLNDSLHCRHTSFHLDGQLTKKIFYYLGEQTYFPDICFDSNQGNRWTTLAGDVQCIHKGIPRERSVCGRDMHCT